METTPLPSELVALSRPGQDLYAGLETFANYRNESHFCEALAVKIRDDVAEALALPGEKVRVILDQKSRGGITITATS